MISEIGKCIIYGPWGLGRKIIVYPVVWLPYMAGVLGENGHHDGIDGNIYTFSPDVFRFSSSCIASNGRKAWLWRTWPLSSDGKKKKKGNFDKPETCRLGVVLDVV